MFLELLLLGSAQLLRGTNGTTLLLSFTGSLLLGLDPLDTGVKSKDRVNKLTETGVVLLLTSGSLRLVLLLSESLVVTRVGTLVDLLVVPLETSPRVEVVEEVIEALDVLFGGVEVTELGNGLDFGETAFTSKEGIGLGTELFGRKFLEVGNFVVDVPVDRVELTSTLGVGKGLMG